MAEPADLLVNVHDLLVDGIRVAGAQDAAGDRLFGGDADQALARPHIGRAARPRDSAIILRGDLRRHAPGQEFRHLRRLLEAGVQKPQGLAADPQAFLVGLADVAQSSVGETVAARRRQPSLAAGIAIGVEGPPAGLGAAQYERVDHAAPAELGRGLGISGRRPHWRMGTLVDRRPDVDVTVSEMLALPAERPVMRGQGLLDQVYRLPEAFDISHRVGIARNHLAVAGFDKADLEPAARDHIRGRVFLGDAHRVGADSDQGPEREDADFLGLPGEDAQNHRAGTIKAVDPGMVLDRDDVDPELVAQQVLVEALLEQVRGNLRVTIFVGQAGAHRLRAVEDVLRYEGIDVLAMVPSLHLFSPVYSSRNAATRSTNAWDCSISGWCPAPSISVKRDPGIS